MNCARCVLSLRSSSQHTTSAVRPCMGRKLQKCLREDGWPRFLPKSPRAKPNERLRNLKSVSFSTKSMKASNKSGGTYPTSGVGAEKRSLFWAHPRAHQADNSDFQWLARLHGRKLQGRRAERPEASRSWRVTKSLEAQSHAYAPVPE